MSKASAEPILLNDWKITQSFAGPTEGSLAPQIVAYYIVGSDEMGPLSTGAVLGATVKGVIRTGGSGKTYRLGEMSGEYRQWLKFRHLRADIRSVMLMLKQLVRQP